MFSRKILKAIIIIILTIGPIQIYNKNTKLPIKYGQIKHIVSSQKEIATCKKYKHTSISKGIHKMQNNEMYFSYEIKKVLKHNNT